MPISNFYVRKDRPSEIIRICKSCAAKRQREYAKANPERIKEISARGREKHREEIKERNRAFYERYKNDPVFVEKRKAYMERTKDYRSQKGKARRLEFNAKWKHPCEKCGEDRLYLIQFHHIDPKTKVFCIGAYADNKSEEELAKEVKKCVCLCSNCHDEFHYFYGNTPKFHVEALKEYLGRDFSDS